jgi:hypothetical protein
MFLKKFLGDISERITTHLKFTALPKNYDLVRAYPSGAQKSEGGHALSRKD